ncbi:hypothetical protein PLICRDRAFT_52218 [Plicaturopsis crispa FD-325 SS-3]|nr:hypothetical protein PLICRDRAFT_52218 [Plicaturopsis crispa FD-325 SS-3]
MCVLLILPKRLLGRPATIIRVQVNGLSGKCPAAIVSQSLHRSRGAISAICEPRWSLHKFCTTKAYELLAFDLGMEKTRISERLSQDLSMSASSRSTFPACLYKIRAWEDTLYASKSRSTGRSLRYLDPNTAASPSQKPIPVHDKALLDVSFVSAQHAGTFPSSPSTV